LLSGKNYPVSQKGKADKMAGGPSTLVKRTDKIEEWEQGLGYITKLVEHYLPFLSVVILIIKFKACFNNLAVCLKQALI
jgi:hypothetical protein